jgi:hypothetical protein
MVTPPPKSSAKGGGPKMYSREEKQQLLDNFDCEGMSIVCIPTPGSVPLSLSMSLDLYR